MRNWRGGVGRGVAGWKEGKTEAHNTTRHLPLAHPMLAHAREVCAARRE